jgi:DinB superfamily
MPLEGGHHVAKQPLTNAELLAMLAAVPPRIATLIAGLVPAQLQAAPAPDQWSANEVLAHLRACADMWGNCIVEILAHDHPTLRAINPRTWINKTDYREQPFQRSLDAFTVQRADLLAVLEPLAPEGWARAATVTGAGKVLERTVLFYARWLAEHERPHVKQIERIVNTMRM